MSELRQDIASGDWVIIAPGRAGRPRFLGQKKKPRVPSPISECPFEDLQKSGNWPPIAAYPNEKNWKIILLPNKYPALIHPHTQETAPCVGIHGNIPHAAHLYRRIYRYKAGTGYHDLVITRDHNKDFADISPAMAAKLFEIFQERHRAMAHDPSNAYIATFFNWGALVGGSIWHPHYQILTLPIVPPYIVRSLAGSKAYFKKHHRCVRCDILREERIYKKRIITENKFAVAFAPYASKNPFEVSILPKSHIPSFGETPQNILHGMVALLQSVLRMMKRNVNDPDLNFFIHGAPLDHDKSQHPSGRDISHLSSCETAFHNSSAAFHSGHRDKYFYHHWHIEVVPRVSFFGGFEYSTEIDINIVDPDIAAAILRGENKK